MFSSIWNDIKREYEFGNMITRIIIVNVVIFTVFTLMHFGFFIFNRGEMPVFYENLTHTFCMSKDWRFLLWHPWIPFTYMFMHLDFWHILWNMLSLYWFGRIIGDLLGDHRVLPLYLLGGLAGAVAYFATANYFPYIGAYALGASASIMAIIVAAGTVAPNYLIRLILIGEVRLKFIVFAVLILDLIGATTSANSGGHFAHLGGALMGYIFVSQMYNGYDMSEPINNLMRRIGNFFQYLKGNRPKPSIKYKNKERVKAKKQAQNQERAVQKNNASVDQSQVDSILDKIRISGYDSLNTEEKEALFKASKN